MTMALGDAAATSFSIRIVDRAGLAALLPAWRGLAQRSADDTLYYAPSYAMALLDTVAAGQAIRIATVWDGGRLVALLPVTTSRLAMPGLAGGQAWRSDHTFGCMPLLDREQPVAAARALLQALSELKAGDWVLPQIDRGSRTGDALIAALDSRSAPWLWRAGFARASIARGASFEAHLQQHVSAKRRRDLGRSRRRLEERGTVSHRICTEGADLAWAADRFLAIEAGGWKGQRGTALACSAATRDFARRAFGGDSHGHARRIDLLLLDGTPIAAGVTLLVGRTGFTVKCAYDEAYAAYGAGLLLEIEAMRSFLSGCWADRLDSATSGGHVIDALWPDRVEVADLAFSLAPAAAASRLALYDRVQSLRGEARSLAKRVLRR